MTEKPKRRWYQFSLRTLLLSVVVASLLSSYVACYYRLSRRGMEEARQAEMEGFFYVPIDDIIAAGEVTPKHCLLLVLFCPANAIDHLLFGTPEALVNAPTMRLC